jgi:hypothetical protein
MKWDLQIACWSVAECLLYTVVVIDEEQLLTTVCCTSTTKKRIKEPKSLVGNSNLRDQIKLSTIFTKEHVKMMSSTYKGQREGVQEGSNSPAPPSPPKNFSYS